MTTFTRQCPPPPSTLPSCSPALARYVTDGLLATIESYRSGTLPLHRFAWELAVRMDVLAALDPAAVTDPRLTA